MHHETVTCYLLIINIITFILYGIDKFNAVRGIWRIREIVLFTFSFMGGSLGGFLAMKIFRHKTKNRKFSFGIPIMLLIHLVILISWI